MNFKRLEEYSKNKPIPRCIWFRSVLHLEKQMVWHMYNCLLRKWWWLHHLWHMKCTAQSMRNVFQGVVLCWQEEAEQHFPSFSWLISLIAAYIVTFFLKTIVTAGGNKIKCNFTSKEGGGLKGSRHSISVLKRGMRNHRCVSAQCPCWCTEPFFGWWLWLNLNWAQE